MEKCNQKATLVYKIKLVPHLIQAGFFEHKILMINRRFIADKLVCASAANTHVLLTSLKFFENGHCRTYFTQESPAQRFELNICKFAAFFGGGGGGWRRN